VDGRDAKADLETFWRQIQQFSAAVHRGEITGSTGQPFRHVVVVGIGGSYLGTEFVACALEAFADKEISLDFLANVDIHNFGQRSGHASSRNRHCGSSSPKVTPPLKPWPTKT
jgi:glucose-6-phosphate isomerase